jgi:hypothetical protein
VGAGLARISPDGRFLAIVADGRVWIRPAGSHAVEACGREQ